MFLYFLSKENVNHAIFVFFFHIWSCALFITVEATISQITPAKLMAKGLDLDNESLRACSMYVYMIYSIYIYVQYIHKYNSQMWYEPSRNENGFTFKQPISLCSSAG